MERGGLDRPGPGRRVFRKRGAPMKDGEAWRAAVELISIHGDSAAGVALNRADNALDSGDVDGFTRWKQVTRLIVEIQSRDPDKNVH